MGKLEKESLKRRRGKEIQRAILKSVALAGLLAIAMTSTNAIGILKALKNDRLHKKIQRGSVNRSRHKLIEQGKLQYQNGYLKLTAKGEAELRKLELNEFRLKTPKKWDKKWRVLIFDIPERKRSLRDKIRLTLMTIGFTKLQASVWVYPYDCEDLITLLKADFKIGKNLLYLIVDTIENDGYLLRRFGLKNKL